MITSSMITWLQRLARWWWRILGVWMVVAGLGLGGLAILPWTSWLPDPVVASIHPHPNAQAVLLDQSLHITFSTAMNRPSVEQAFSLDPSLPGAWQWQDDQTALWLPENGWSANTHYTATLSRLARSRFRQPLAEVFQSNWTTVSAPVVVGYWPTNQQPLMTTAAPVWIQFDRAMAQPATPPVRFEPFVPPTQRWLNPTTMLIYAPFQAGTSYTVTLENLTDQIGTPVQPFSWTLDTAPLQVLHTTPEAANEVQPTTPLVIEIQGLVPATTFAAITAQLQLQPPQHGTWSVEYTTAGHTAFTFSPQQGWQANQLTATLDLSGSAPLTWSWRVLQPLTIVATVPGRNGLHDPAEEVRLIFAAPPTPAALSSALQIEPPLEDLRLEVLGAEVSIRGAFRPTTAYTLSFQPDPQIPATIVPFQTSAGLASLEIISPTDALSVWHPAQQPHLTLQASKPEQVTAELYQLDRALLLAGLRPGATLLQPARLGLQPVQRWSFGPTQVATVTFDQLAPGIAYLFEARDAASGTIVQHILLVSAVQLYIVTSADQAYVYAVDPQTGLPQADLELVMLQQGSLLASGTTDQKGVWLTPLPPGSHPDAVIGGPESNIVLGFTQAVLTPRQRQFTALLDRPIAHQGERIYVAGTDQSTSSEPFQLRLRNPSGMIVDQYTVPLAPSGAFSQSVRLRAHYEPGAYSVKLGEQQLALQIDPALPDGWNIVVPYQAEAGSQVQGRLMLRTATGLPVALRTITWEVHSADGSWQAQGQLQTDVTGTVLIDLALPATLQPGLLTWRWTLDDHTVQRSMYVVEPSQLMLELDRHVVEPGATIQLTATLPYVSDQPRDQQPIDISISGNAAPERIRGFTNAAGQATFTWRLRGNGRFDFQAFGPTTSSTVQSVWSARAGFSTWDTPAAPELPLAVERSLLRPGQPFRLLPLINTAQARAQLIMPTPQGLEVVTQTWQAGTPIEGTLNPRLRGPQQIVVLLETASGTRIATTTVVYDGSEALALLNADTQLQPLTQQPLTYTLLLHPTLPSPTTIQPSLAPHQRAGIHGPGMLVIESATAAQVIPLELESVLPAKIIAPPQLHQGDQALVYVLNDQLKRSLTPAAPPGLSSGPGLVLDMYDSADSSAPSGWWLTATAAGTSGLTATLGFDQLLLSQPVTVNPTYTRPYIWQSLVLTQPQTLTLTSQAAPLLLATAPGISGLYTAALTSLESDPTLLARAGRIALAQSDPDLPLPYEDIAFMLGAQQASGGWGWGNGEADALLSGYIMRLLATGTPNNDVQHMLERADSYLQAQQAHIEDTYTHVVIQAALARYKTIAVEPLLNLLKQPELPADQQLLLLQALLDQRLDRRAQAMIERLDPFSMLQPSDSSAPWMTAQYRVALLASSIWQVDPSNPALTPILQALGQTWHPDWSNPVATTEILLFLNQLPTASARTTPYSISVDNQPFYSGVLPLEATTITTTVPTLSLHITTRGPVSLAYTQATSASHILVGELRDAWTNELQNSFRPGQLVRLNWTLHVSETLDYVELELPTSPVLAIEAFEAPGFHLQPHGLWARQLQPGSYTISMVGRPAFTGTFHWSQPRLNAGGQLLPLDIHMNPLQVQ